jgi:hypothetical protein
MSQYYRDTTFLGEPKPAGMDNNAHGVELDGDTFENCTFDANGASEALKASRKFGVKVLGGRSIGGVEDCHDYVRGGQLVVRGHEFKRGKAQRDVTIKGSFRGAQFLECPGLRFITAGDYTKYDLKAIYPDGRTVNASPTKCARPPVRECHVNVAPGQPKVWVLNIHSQPWTGDVRNIRLPVGHALVVAFYFWARATFWKEKLPPAPEQFQLEAREL